MRSLLATEAHCAVWFMVILRHPTMQTRSETHSRAGSGGQYIWRGRRSSAARHRLSGFARPGTVRPQHCVGIERSGQMIKSNSRRRQQSREAWPKGLAHEGSLARMTREEEKKGWDVDMQQQNRVLCTSFVTATSLMSCQEACGSEELAWHFLLIGLGHGSSA